MVFQCFSPSLAHLVRFFHSKTSHCRCQIGAQDPIAWNVFGGKRVSRQESDPFFSGWFGGTPILGNLHMPTNYCLSWFLMDMGLLYRYPIRIYHDIIDHIGDYRDPWTETFTMIYWLVFFFFHILGRIIPTDFHIFQRGRSTTNQYMISKNAPPNAIAPGTLSGGHCSQVGFNRRKGWSVPLLRGISCEVGYRSPWNKMIKPC